MFDNAVVNHVSELMFLSKKCGDLIYLTKLFKHMKFPNDISHMIYVSGG